MFDFVYVLFRNPGVDRSHTKMAVTNKAYLSYTTLNHSGDQLCYGDICFRSLSRLVLQLMHGDEWVQVQCVAVCIRLRIRRCF